MYVTHNREFNKTITRSRFVFDTYIITKKKRPLTNVPRLHIERDIPDFVT